MDITMYVVTCRVALRSGYYLLLAIYVLALRGILSVTVSVFNC